VDAMTQMIDSYTSSGQKYFWHQEAMRKLQNGQGQPIVTHVMCCDRCNHSCGFCSVAAREGDSLPLKDICSYLDILLKYSLRAVILSGGGNPILYRCPVGGYNFNHLVDEIHGRGLEIGLITNGMPLKSYGDRVSWKTVSPETLDKLTWVRISMSGLDHEENEVYVPSIDREKTTLGMSYIAHDLFYEPADPHHGKVSTPGDLITLNRSRIKPTWWFKDRVPQLTEQIRHYVREYNPAYVRLLPDCLSPELIPERCDILQGMADAINPSICFVQKKPPSAPRACYIGYAHPVLAPDGYCYPCDSVVLAAANIGYKDGKPNHKFDQPWRMCHWSEIERLYTEPIHSLVDPQKLCQGCVFTGTCNMLDDVVTGKVDPAPPTVQPLHANFV
jgi:MoaA/NifB/PqqE/SkfB family radical SAM enzyme